MEESPELRKNFIEMVKDATSGYEKIMGLLGQIMEENAHSPAPVNVTRPTEPLITEPLIDATKDETKGLGRLVSLDPRDSKYPLSAVVSKRAGLTYRYWKTGKVLDQLDTSECVAYSGEQFLATGPVTNKFYKSPHDLYTEARKVDEWEGEDYDGTSVRALFKVLQDAKYIKEYRWATDIQTVVSHLLQNGPVILGTDWYNSMFYPDAITGFLTLRASSGLAGGHAYMVKGCNNNKLCPDGSRGAIRIINSWGTQWGDKGHAWLSYSDADRLIKNWGEAATALELKFIEEGKG